MRRIRVRRVVGLTVAALGLVATSTPPAQATTAGNLTFQGAAFLSGGFSYPCIGQATPTSAKCPTPVLNPSGPPGKTVAMTGGNTRGFAFASSVCVGTDVTNVPSELSTGAGTCSMSAAGVATGSCGLSAGLLTYTIKIDKVAVLLLPSTKLIYLLTVINGTIHFTSVGGTVLLVGDTSTGGTLVGVVQANAIYDISGIPPGNSCLSKTADEFTIAGEVGFVAP